MEGASLSSVCTNGTSTFTSPSLPRFLVRFVLRRNLRGGPATLSITCLTSRLAQPELSRILTENISRISNPCLWASQRPLDLSKRRLAHQRKPCRTLRPAWRNHRRLETARAVRLSSVTPAASRDTRVHLSEGSRSKVGSPPAIRKSYQAASQLAKVASTDMALA